MSTEMHERAQQLIAQERIEGIAETESAWLAGHLGECAECAAVATATSVALRTLRTAPIDLPPGLAARTQFRVSLRARQLQQDGPRRRALWIAAGISWVAGVASAPFVWRLFAWLGEQAGVPKLVWEAGFALWWAVPVLVAAVVLLTEHEKGRSEWVPHSR